MKSLTILIVISLEAFLLTSCSSSDPAAGSRPGINNDPAAASPVTATASAIPASSLAAEEPTPAPVVRIESPNGLPVLRSSDFLGVLDKYRKDHPDLPVKEIAEYGNSLLAQKGFDYQIDLAPLNEKKEKSRETTVISDDLYYYPYEMTLVDGPRQKFLIVSPRNDSCCCGYYYAYLPVTNITEKTITFVAEGKTYRVKRPRDFGHNEVYALVDADDPSRELRKWQVPSEGYPLGISEDGTKLYVEGAFEDIYLELAEDGSFKLVPRDEVRSGKGEFYEVPENPKDVYEGCYRFRIADKTYLVRFSAPCT